MINPETFHPEFTGIWIPKEIWYCNELSLLEKHFLIEIEGLDNGQGCYASNEFFSNFFGISKARSSQVINSLVSKDYLKADLIYKPGTKEVVKRILKIGSKFPKGGSKKSKGGIKDINQGIKFSNHPPLENAEDTNILLTNINTKTDTILNNIAGSIEPANPELFFSDNGNDGSKKPDDKSKGKTAKAKVVTLEQEFANKCFTSLVDVWVKEIHPDWVKPMNGSEGKALKEIIPKIKAKLEQNRDEVTIESITALFRIICMNLPDFWKQHKLTSINSNFNTIIEHIKNKINGKSTKKPESARSFFK